MLQISSNTCRSVAPLLLVIALSSPALGASLSDLNLPPHFRRKVEARKFIDLRLEKDFRTEAPVQPPPVQKPPKRFTERTGVVRLRETNIPAELLARRAALPNRAVPLRGYRIALGSELTNQWQATLPEVLTDAERIAAAHLSERLAFDGLLPTLVKVIELLAPVLRDRELDQLPAHLARIGFPVDLAAYFRPEGKDAIAFISERLRRGETGESLRTALAATEFNFQPADNRFECIAENGEHPLRSIRVQIRGGYEHQGFIPTASLDVAEQLVRALPEVRIMASIEQSFLPLLKMQASLSWGLRRRNQLTILSEPLPVSPWARDNGVAGILRGQSNAVAILTPRYASMGEGESLLLPGESFLMNGLEALGLKIIQSPLLFQGGNLLVVREPSGTRTLLLSESEIYRNTALGLKSNEVVQAFQREFSSDRTLVVPSCSYHLDFDVTIRTVSGQIVAFINDPLAAAGVVVGLGVDALAQNAVLTPTEAADLRAQADANQWPEVGRFLFARFERFKTARGELSEQLCNIFRATQMDAPGANLRTLCTALDLLAGGQRVGARYAEALSAIHSAIERQRRVLEAQGWKVVTIPSMPDLHWGINYINGVHDPERYLMPAYGGFFARLDEVAMAAIQSAVGSSVKIIPLYCGELQRYYGAIHCMVSVLPEVDS